MTVLSRACPPCSPLCASATRNVLRLLLGVDGSAHAYILTHVVTCSIRNTRNHTFIDHIFRAQASTHLPTLISPLRFICSSGRLLSTRPSSPLFAKHVVALSKFALLHFTLPAAQASTHLSTLFSHLRVICSSGSAPVQQSHIQQKQHRRM